MPTLRTPPSFGWKHLKTAFLVTGMSWFVIAASGAPQNLIELHKNPGSSTNQQCLKCHQGILQGKTAKPEIKTFHRLHLQSKLETPKECLDCHQSVDLREGSAGALRKQVDPSICAGCHDGGMPGAKKLYR